MVARVLGAAPVLADAIIDQLAAPSDKATDTGMQLTPLLGLTQRTVYSGGDIVCTIHYKRQGCSCLQSSILLGTAAAFFGLYALFGPAGGGGGG